MGVCGLKKNDAGEKNRPGFFLSLLSSLPSFHAVVILNIIGINDIFQYIAFERVKLTNQSHSHVLSLILFR